MVELEGVGMEEQKLAAAIAAAITQALDNRGYVSRENHEEHHEWVASQIAKQKARTEFWQALAAKSLPAIVWTLIAAGATGLWQFIKNHWTW